MKHARIGATFFILWGLLHIAGGMSILWAVFESPERGFAIYEESSSPYTSLAGSILGYLAYSLAWIGMIVTIVGIRYNWNNNRYGLIINTTLIGMTDLGLIAFLVLPGFVSWAEAASGLLLFVGAVIFGSVACRSAHRTPQIRVRSPT